jgi:hypothetical protein
MKGVKPGELTEPTVYISLEKGEFDQAAFDALKDGLKERIASSPEYQELKGAGKQSSSDDEAYAGVDPDDTIPF